MPNCQRFCLSQSPAEITEVLKGLKERYISLHVPFPEMAVTDNCCHVRRAIEEAFTGIAVILDVHHFMMRYGTIKCLMPYFETDSLLFQISRNRSQGCEEPILQCGGT